jgi:hypothetical protein
MSAQPENVWLGDLEGYLAWAEHNWHAGNGWCPRHWAPCPVEGLNGLVASVRLAEEGLSRAPRRIRRAKGRAALELNVWLAAQTEPLCCLLGDDAVGALWDEVRTPQHDAV